MTQASPSIHAGAAGKPWAVTPEKVEAVVKRLVKAASPLRLIAFGSAVRGDLAAANDLDLLVVEPELASRYNETVRLQKTLRGILMSVDLVVPANPSTTNAAKFQEPWSSLRTEKGACCMTPSDQARLLLRKAAQDLAVLDKPPRS